jgi:AcrR family transcriptional regulator
MERCSCWQGKVGGMMTRSNPNPARLAMRADAQRNYERILAAARAAIAEEGTDASLRDVARRSGVGIGTLYRHFPTRDALIEALLRQSFNALRATGEDLLATGQPEAALVAWLREFADSTTAYRGLPAAVMAALGDEGSELHAACQAMQTAGARLLARAQQAGVVRPEVTAMDLFAFAAAIGWASEQAPDQPDLANRLTSLMLTGMRAVANKSA